MIERDDLHLEDLDLSPLTGAAPAPPPLRPEVLAAVGEAPAPVSPIWPTWARVGLAAGSGALISLVALAMTTSREAPTWLGLAWIGLAGIWVAVTVGLTWLTLLEARPEVSEAGGIRAGVVVLVGLAFGGYALAEELLDHGRIGIPGAAELLEGARTCLALGSILELGPVILIFFLLLRGATFHPVRAGALGGIAAAGWSVLVLTLHCPSTSLLHVLPFHLGVALVWGLLGAGLGLVVRARRGRFPVAAARG
ncbi:MAG: NrsF family protein [Deltaproteobacteria bacterium]|nr:NrsF family protein [Deltaproteobacteria bacterium]